MNDNLIIVIFNLFVFNFYIPLVPAMYDIMNYDVYMVPSKNVFKLNFNIIFLNIYNNCVIHYKMILN